MRFFHVPVTSFEDATANFEQAGTAFLALLTGQEVRLALGTVTLTWAGATIDSAQVTVPHGLGKVPLLSGGFQVNAAALGFRAAVMNNAAANATNLFLAATALDGTPGAAATSVVGWFAIG